MTHVAACAAGIADRLRARRPPTAAGRRSDVRAPGKHRSSFGEDRSCGCDGRFAHASRRGGCYWRGLKGMQRSRSADVPLASRTSTNDDGLRGARVPSQRGGVQRRAWPNVQVGWIGSGPYAGRHGCVSARGRRCGGGCADGAKRGTISASCRYRAMPSRHDVRLKMRLRFSRD
jgi:hypothetical protein